ncbi:MAG: protein-glutamate O-methyltransferase CheR [Syntrophobacter sp.]
MSPISTSEVSLWSTYIHSICGVQLDTTKAYLIETRLAPLLREMKVASLGELYSRVKSDPTQALKRRVIDAITTNETSFFRDTSPFELLQHKIVPDLVDKRTRSNPNGRSIPIRIWSAACSTGQEVYSTAIVLKELLMDLNRYDIRILGTDISDKAIAAASYGQYSKMEMDRGMALDKIAKYFSLTSQKWKIRDELRALATFKTMNLLEPFTMPGKFDIVFCRNVAIYFSEQDKLRLFRSIANVMAPDGYLIIGSTESITGLCPQFEPKRYLRAVFYQLKGA